MGIVGAGNCGTAISALFAPRLAELVGWHGVFGFAIVPVLVTLVIICLVAKEQPAPQSQQRLGHYLNVLREPDAWWFSLFYMVTFGGFVGLASFLAIFFHDQYGLSRVMAGNFTALCVFAGSLVRPIGGHLADRFGGIKCLLALFGVVGSLMLLVGQLPPLPWAIFALFLGISALGMGNGAVFQLVPQRFRNQIGVMTGLVGFGGGIGGFYLASSLGLIKQATGSTSIGFLIFAGLALIAVAGLTGVKRRWRTTWGAAVGGVKI